MPASVVTMWFWPSERVPMFIDVQTTHGRFTRVWKRVILRNVYIRELEKGLVDQEDGVKSHRESTCHFRSACENSSERTMVGKIDQIR